MIVETFNTVEERNERWAELREQREHVVRFSGSEPTGETQTVQYKLKGHVGREQQRPVFRSTFSVAYPAR